MGGLIVHDMRYIYIHFFKREDVTLILSLKDLRVFVFFYVFNGGKYRNISMHECDVIVIFFYKDKNDVIVIFILKLNFKFSCYINFNFLFL